MENLARNIEKNTEKNNELSEKSEELKEPEVIKPETEETREPKKKHGLKIFLIVMFAVLLVLAGFVFYLTKNDADFFNRIAKISSGEYEVVVQSSQPTLSEEETEEQIREAEETRKEERVAKSLLDYDGGDMETTLRNIIYLIHRSAPATSSEADPNVFLFYNAYDYNSKLYQEKTLTNAQKNELLLFQLASENKFVPLISFLIDTEIDVINASVPDSDSLHKLTTEYNLEGHGIQGEVVARFYRQVFGEEIQHGEDLEICGSYAYNSAYNFYYLPGGLGGCGGMVTEGTEGYMRNFRVEDRVAKVDIYTVTYEISGYIPEINEENYGNYEKHTFDFEINRDGTYKFLRIE